MKQKHTHRHKDRLAAKGWRKHREGMDREFGVNRYKLLYVKWVNKVLLCGTRDYIQYPVINCNGKNMKKNVCMYNRIILLYGRINMTV